MNDPFAELGAAQRQAALTAVKTVLHANVSTSIRPLGGGKSGAFVFLVEAATKRFVLRLEGTPSPLRNPHQYETMRIAADAGLAPAIHYVDADSRVVMMDFVDDKPPETYPGGPLALARAVGAMLRDLQALPLFPAFMDYPEIVGRVWTHVCKTGLFADGVLDAATERLASIRAAYDLQREQHVSSHNDVVPRNLLFDGQRLWLIDWENGFRNDALVDVATALDNFAPTPELEDALLLSWSGRRPDDPLRQRLAQVRALTRLFYAGVLFSASAAGLQAREDRSLAAPTSVEFERAIRGGQLVAETAETSQVLGKMYLAAFLSDTVLPPGLPPLYMR